MYIKYIYIGIYVYVIISSLIIKRFLIDIYTFYIRIKKVECCIKHQNTNKKKMFQRLSLSLTK